MLDGATQHRSLNIIQNNPPPIISSQNITELDIKCQDNDKITDDLNQTQDSSQATASSGYASDKLNLLMMLGLYITWGLVFGYFVNSMQVILIEKGASNSSLSKLTIMGYPFTLKFLFSPLVDTYYFRSMGKHKTYIVLTNYFISGFLFLSAFYIEDWINNKEVAKITTMGFFLVFFLSFQSIAVDAWPPSLLHPENMRYVGFISNFGQMIGLIFAYNLFIWFNDPSFCNTYIYSTNHEKPLMSNFAMVLTLALAFLVINFLVHVFKREKQVQKKDFQSFREFLLTISKFVTNPNVRFLIFVTFFIGVGIQPVELGYVMLLRKGFSQNTLSLIDMISNIISTMAGIFGSYLAKKKKEFSCIIVVFAINIPCDILYFFFIHNYEKIDPKVALVFYMIEDVGLGIFQTIYFVLFISFILRVADPKITAIYTTFFYSIIYLKELWTVSLSLLLIDYVDYMVLCFTGIGFVIVFLLVFTKRIRRMETTEKNLWLLSE